MLSRAISGSARGPLPRRLPRLPDLLPGHLCSSRSRVAAAVSRVLPCAVTASARPCSDWPAPAAAARGGAVFPPGPLTRRPEFKTSFAKLGKVLTGHWRERLPAISGKGISANSGSTEEGGGSPGGEVAAGGSTWSISGRARRDGEGSGLGEMKYVVVTGGVVSGLGKGVTASSIGVVLKACGLRCTAIKIDPYINTDAGTMSPFEHGEVFVLDDGGEVDLDLGNYERFLDVTLTRDNNITTGKVYQAVIERERRGDYLGKTVQVVPHITNAIQEWIERVAQVSVDGSGDAADVCVIELGGTVGDIESMPFIEALRQFQFRVGPDNFCLVHVSLVPVLGVVGEQKTKPTQHSVRELRALGLTPNLLACRSAEPLQRSTKEKLAQFCHVPANHVLNLHDVNNIWHVPLLLRDQGAHVAILSQFRLPVVPPEFPDWEARATRWDNLSTPVKIAMVGKYTGLSDSYLSVLKALQHASIACNRKLLVEWVASSDLEDNTKNQDSEQHKKAFEVLERVDGILVPGGFGDRGVEGKIKAAEFARTKRIPYLGICLGMQVAVIEFMRNVMGHQAADSTEFNPNTADPCILFMPEGSKTHMGGTMRLGTRKTKILDPHSLTAKLYQSSTEIDERHRHRYEVNPDMVEGLEKAGMHFVGRDTSGKRMEVLEVEGHPFFVASQFHPEFKSRPGRPSPLFFGFIRAASGELEHLEMNGVEKTPKRVKV